MGKAGDLASSTSPLGKAVEWESRQISPSVVAGMSFWSGERPDSLVLTKGDPAGICGATMW